MTQRGGNSVPELIAKLALDHAPLTKAGVTLALMEAGPITSIALLPGGEKALAKGLKTLGLAMPEPNTSAAKGAARIVWTGRDQAFLMGVPAPELQGAAVTDQSDGWAGLSLSGPLAEDALARLVAIDLRASAFPSGRVARVGLNHMSMILLRSGDEAFELFVFRSMARTAWHELAEVLDHLAARVALNG